MHDPLQIEYPTMVRPDTYTNGAFCYIAEHPDLPGCVGYGNTLSKAKESLSVARVAYISQLLAEGENIPGPSPSRPSSVEWESSPSCPRSVEWESAEVSERQLEPV
jgi:predicted RNase H-like HicB family nuclease